MPPDRVDGAWQGLETSARECLYMFIVIEGIDSVGKSSLNWLKVSRIDSLSTHTILLSVVRHTVSALALCACRFSVIGAFVAFITFYTLSYA
jgi:hypothetical protein